MNNYFFYIFITFLFIASSGCVSNDDPDVDSILYRINDERIHNNLTMVYEDTLLDGVAEKRANDLMKYSLTHNMMLTHNIPRTGYPDEALKIYGIGWTSYGEINGYSNNNSSIMAGWKNSSSHYKSIMNENYRKAGIGISKKNNTVWFLVLFTS